ncbi:glycosyltransferase family 4 protein [Nostoc sp. CENA67]|uniref:Glycosyltransferase family 4 protein n=1 Tax=Amazonocrinis nigriterrae CENA67 TaxID=2794033 RepID=A0A8J7HTU3_9NOST|nr:glycosyltransferase [Amazonocrinis nigriterrae]MBH8562375.1 glycosyltransferase family 4 protein [Amazonocrinis nigriterrae CENA67]MBH8562404.1 glycosyltransferase family 4 protein [Amazonocrinis nigriterrae CENA67]
MRVLVSAPARFALTSDGNLWSQSESQAYKLWSRYLNVYDEVHILVRAKLHLTPPSGWKKVTGPGIKAVPVPYFVGPWEFIKKYISVRKTISEAVKNAEAIQLRLPCTIGSEVWRLLPSLRPYGVEIIADPYDVFAPGSVQHPLSPIFRRLFSHELKQQCFKAPAALYVTKKALQQRYPCPNYTDGVSDVCLPKEIVLSAPRPLRQGITSFRLVFVGTMAQLYKAPDILIKAVAACVQEGLDLKLIMVGDGKHRTELEAQATALGLKERIYFRGQLSSSDAVRADLDQADLFVLPSYQEGLPRAMIEAMARGLPCIGSTVGGIPELLPPEDMVPPGDVTALAQKIREVVTDAERMASMSARNLETAKEYIDEILSEQRIAFYKYVRNQTELWLNKPEFDRPLPPGLPLLQGEGGVTKK